MKKYFWKFVYACYPPILRVLEKAGAHKTRQAFLIGHFNTNYKVADLEKFLRASGYDLGVLSWCDPGEIINLRKLEGPLHQYHVRVFDDHEIRVHYEYASEARPLQHVLEIGFEPRYEYFQELLGDYLIRLPK